MIGTKLCKLFAAGLVAASIAGPATASLILNTTITENGSGLGALPTVVTVLDNGSGGNGTESGCISANGAGSNFSCLNGLQGGDNQAINNLITLSSLTGISNAGQLAVVVNLNEPGSDTQAVLTDLYLAFFSSTGVLLGNHQYTGPDLVLDETPGIGSAGTVFTLDAAQALLAIAECPVLSECRVGGGIQFAEGSTAGGPETMFLSFVPQQNQVPEPGTLSRVALALATLSIAARRRLKDYKAHR